MEITKKAPFRVGDTVRVINCASECYKLEGKVLGTTYNMTRIDIPGNSDYTFYNSSLELIIPEEAHKFIGSTAKEEYLKAWALAPGDNYNIGKGWKEEGSLIYGDRTVVKLDVIEGHAAFQVSGTTDDIWFKLEGFQEFIAEKKLTPMKQEEKNLIDEAIRRYPVGTEYLDCGSGIPYTVSVQSFSINYNGLDIEVYGETGKGILYKEGMWATVERVDPFTFVVQKKKKSFTQVTSDPPPTDGDTFQQPVLIRKKKVNNKLIIINTKN